MVSKILWDQKIVRQVITKTSFVIICKKRSFNQTYFQLYVVIVQILDFIWQYKIFWFVDFILSTLNEKLFVHLNIF